MAKVKKKGELRKILYDETYERILFWKDGSWSRIGFRDQPEGKPVTEINLLGFYDVTYKQIDSTIKEIETALNEALLYEQQVSSNNK